MDAPEQKQKRVPMLRPGSGSKGLNIHLLTNHFDVKITNTDGYLFQYSVALYYEDRKPVEMKGVGRKVMDKIKETYSSELGGKEFAYDGEKTLFTVGSLPKEKLEFIVLLNKVSSKRTDVKSSPGGNGSPNENDKRRRNHVAQSKTFKVDISYATQIPIKAISGALRGKKYENFLDAVQVPDTVLRQHAANQGCLSVKQSFFRDDDRNFDVLGGGILVCKGYHSSFRATQSGLSLNMGLLTTPAIVAEGLRQQGNFHNNGLDNLHCLHPPEGMQDYPPGFMRAILRNNGRQRLEATIVLIDGSWNRHLRRSGMGWCPEDVAD